MKIQSKQALLQHANNGRRLKYVFFWGHQAAAGNITKTCLSQWYETSFTDEAGITYRTAEHYMMAEKAKLFGDSVTFKKIIKSSNPGQVKSLGREVKGFNDSIWQTKRIDIVVAGNLLKFSQNIDLKNFLLSTKDRILVEASPVDRIWGIGLAHDDPRAQNPNLWNGGNLLGFALMEVRDALREA